MKVVRLTSRRLMMVGWAEADGNYTCQKSSSVQEIGPDRVALNRRRVRVIA